MYSTKDVSRFDYLRHRPFLVVEAIMSPSGRTEQPGWPSDPMRIKINERPSLVERVSDRILRTASVIIDIQNDVIVKNNLSNDNDGMLKNMKERHAHLVEHGKALCAANEG